MRFEMLQCDALLPGCDSQVDVDNADYWLSGTGWRDDYGNVLEDVCPRCADKLALEAEHEVVGA